MTDFDQNGNALDKLNFDIQPGTGLNIPGVIKKSERRQEGSSDFSMFLQGGLFNHEQYNLRSKLNPQCFPTGPTASVDPTKINEQAAENLDPILGSFVQPFRSSAPDSSTAFSTSSSLPNLFCPVPGLTDFNQYKDASASQTLISKDTDKKENGETSLACLSDLIRNKVDQIASEIWKDLTTPIIEFPQAAVLGAGIGLYLRITHVYKDRLARDALYVKWQLSELFKFRHLEKMPKDMFSKLALGMDGLDTKKGWTNYVNEIHQIINDEGIQGFERVWEPVLTADPPKPSEDLLRLREFEFTEKPDPTEWNTEKWKFLREMYSEQLEKEHWRPATALWSFKNNMQRELLAEPEKQAIYNYYSYVEDVKQTLTDIKWHADLANQGRLAASIFTVNGIVNNIFSILLDAVFLPSVVLLVKRNINPMF